MACKYLPILNVWTSYMQPKSFCRDARSMKARTSRCLHAHASNKTQAPVPITAPVPEADASTQSVLRIKVESPQFRSVNWYECVLHEDGKLPVLLARYDSEERMRKLQVAQYCHVHAGFGVSTVVSPKRRAQCLDPP